MSKIRNFEILRPKTLDGKKGFVNPDNEWVIAPDYEDVDVFREGVCWIKQGGKWGLINKHGEYLIEPRFEDAREFNRGYANVRMQGKWGVIDRNGNMIFQPEFDLIRTFKDGVATVVKNNKSGFINIKNQSIIEPIYEEVHDFSEGLAAVESNGLWGFVNLDGEMVISPQFFKVDVNFGEFGEGRAYVEKQGEDKDEYGFSTPVGTFIDREGNALEEWEEVDCGDNDDWSYEEDPRPRSGIRATVGFIDTEGNWAIRPKFQIAKSFKDNIAIVRIDHKWGLIDKSGAYIVEPDFDKIRRYEDGTYSFEKDNEVIYTNQNFDIIPEPVKEDSKDSWLDSILKDDDREEEANPEQNEEANKRPETVGNYKLLKNRFPSVVLDKDNNVVLKDDVDTYGQLISISEEMVRTQKGDNFGFVIIPNGEYREPIFNYLWDFSEGLAAARITENQQ